MRARARTRPRGALCNERHTTHEAATGVNPEVASCASPSGRRNEGDTAGPRTRPRRQRHQDHPDPPAPGAACPRRRLHPDPPGSEPTSPTGLAGSTWPVR